MLLPPANEVWGKVIFLHLFVILFTGGGEVPDQVHPRDQVHPPEQTPPGSRPLRDQVHPLGADTPPGPGTPPEQAPPLQDQVHPPRPGTPSAPGTPPEQTPPPTRYTPPQQSMLGDMVNVRAVRILLECNLVLKVNAHYQITSFVKI